MRKLRNTFCVIVALFIILSQTYSQTNFFNQPTFSISFFNHSLGIPFKDISKLPLNIGVTAGVEFSYSDAPISKYAQRLEIGWFRHRNLNSGLWLKSDYIRRFTHRSGVFADVRGGLGYIMDFSENETFKLNDQGKYELRKKTGSSGLLISLGLGTGYRLEIDESMTISPFIRYESMIQTPYSKFQSFLPQSLLHLGTNFQYAK